MCLIALIGISCIGYGFSTTFPSAVAWQVFGGLMSSNIAMTRCIVAEINPEKRSVTISESPIQLTISSYRTRALLLLPLFANLGMLSGPLIGGFLSKTNSDGMFKAYPYAPPNMLTAAIYLAAAAGVFLGLEETLESLRHNERSFGQRTWNYLTVLVFGASPKRHKYSVIASEDPSSPATESAQLSPTAPTTAGIRPLPQRKAKLPFLRIWTANVLCTMLAHFIIAGHLATFTNLWAIFLSTPVGSSDQRHPPFRFNGGLGLQPRDVGFAMAFLGAIGIILQLLVYPMLNDRFGTVLIWRSALYVFPLTYVLAPFPSLFASQTTSIAQTALIWLSLSGVLVLFVIGRSGVTPATTLLINDCTPHPSVRGTIHTTGTVIANLSRSVFPVVAFAIFGEGLKIGVVGLGFWCVACLAVLACVASRWVKEGSNGAEIVLDGDVEEPPTAEGIVARPT